MRLRIVVLLLIVATVVGTCASCAPRRPGSRPTLVRTFVPPANYAGWYESAERCAGMKGRFEAVTWVITPTPWGDTTYGEWSVVRDSSGFVKRVEIVINAKMWLDSMLIKHEALHDILWRNGWSPPNRKMKKGEKSHHPSPPFGTCAPFAYPWPE